MDLDDYEPGGCDVTAKDGEKCDDEEYTGPNATARSLEDGIEEEWEDLSDEQREP